MDDTVRVRKGGDDSGQSWPSFIGRVVDVQVIIDHVENSITPTHPGFHDAQQKQDNPGFLKLQWYLSRDQSAQYADAFWPLRDADTLLACRDLEEVAPTNCTVWIAIEQVEEFYPVLHRTDCLNHTFGNAAGRGSTAFTCCNATFDANGNIRISDLLYENYHAFGPGTRQRFPSIINETERQVETSHILIRCARKVMNRNGDIGGTFGATFALGRSTWTHVDHSLNNILFSNHGNKNIREALYHTDLTVGSESLPSNRTELTAKTADQFAAVKAWMNCGAGAGIKKRPPPAGERLDVDEGDTVHLCEVDIAALEDDARADWFPDHVEPDRLGYFNEQRQFIKFRYDSRTSELRMTFRALAIKVGGCDADPVLNYLNANGVTWGTDDDPVVVEEHPDNPELRIGRPVHFEDNLWRIYHIDAVRDRIHIERRDLEAGLRFTRDLALAVAQNLPLM